MVLNLKGWRFPDLLTKPPFLQWILILLVLTLSVKYAGLQYENYKERNSKVTPVVIAQINPTLKKEAKVDTPLKTPATTVKTYSSGSKGLIKLPPEVIGDDNKFLTSSSVVPSTEKRQVVSTVLDVTTGETEAYVASQASPWFALENRGQVTLDYGYKRNNSSPVSRLNVRQDLVEIKGIHLGVTGSVFSDGDYFVGVGGSYRW